MRAQCYQPAALGFPTGHCTKQITVDGEVFVSHGNYLVPQFTKQKPIYFISKRLTV